MKKPFRTFLVILIAVFAMAAVLSAASAAVMQAKMTMAKPGDIKMSGCVDCGSGDRQGTSPSCDTSCISPTFIAAEAFKYVPPPYLQRTVPKAVSGIAGPTGPPEPYPPKRRA